MNGNQIPSKDRYIVFSFHILLLVTIRVSGQLNQNLSLRNPAFAGF